MKLWRRRPYYGKTEAERERWETEQRIKEERWADLVIRFGSTLHRFQRGEYVTIEHLALQHNAMLDALDRILRGEKE